MSGNSSAKVTAEEPKALKLTEEYRPDMPVKALVDWCAVAVATLRRLHELCEWNGQMAELHLRRVEELEDERSVLLAALNAMLTHMGMDEDEWNKPTFEQARAAIARAEGSQT